MSNSVNETTLVLVKPDGVQRGLIGEIIGRLERVGLKIRGIKMLQVSQELAELHYAEHADRGFYPELVKFITSSPVVAMAISGPQGITRVRKIMGLTDPLCAEMGSIRADLALDLGNNLIHGSAHAKDASRELTLFFKPGEILDYNRSIDEWIGI